MTSSQDTQPSRRCQASSCVFACNCTWVTQLILAIERKGPGQQSQAASVAAATCIEDEVKMLRAPGPQC